MERIFKRSSFAVILICFTIISYADKQVSKSLPRSVPEAEGVSSRAVITFLYSASKSFACTALVVDFSDSISPKYRISRIEGLM